MRAPFMGGSFPVPGEIWLRHGRRGRGRAGGADRPQCLCAASAPDRVRPAGRGRGAVAGRLPLSRAVLAANMETALNATWDAAPGPAGRIAVVGAGVVGALVGFLCARIEGAEVTLVDIDPARAELAAGAGPELRDARRGAGRLRSRVSRQRHGGGLAHRARPRRRRGDHARTELVRRGDGARCRSAARSTAAA